jgi:hypothetical protein
MTLQALPELLGSFYLGANYDLKTGRRTEVALNYDARDLTTHAVCVGMTGSGKTGLCVDLLEEAAIDQVPAILIDPKGDLTNLLLQFPGLRPEDFQPWVDPDEARRKGQGVADFARTTAARWRDGLADWGISPERIQTLQETAEFSIYTPGSSAGLPVSILGSLAAPDLDFETHAEPLRERIGSTAVALLSLVGIEADPIRDREAILLSTIFEHFWTKKEDLDLAKLITAIQTPPVRQLGVFDVDTFYPQKERFELAMAFNNLVAAPGFQTWLAGDPLNVDGLFYTAAGKPRHSIFYIAHLSDSERMFFVTLLLENLVTWMRRQQGTSSLRALLYFDEIFGFFPPSREPPTKRPLLTLLKQARAFGLGCVLATQNPVDIDYKGLSNAGTWFIGKLQTDRDRDRVVQGLKGAISQAGGAGRVDYNALIGRLDSRVFLMHNVHEDEPAVFQTRWAMSYLRGPLTRPQIQTLMEGRLPAPSAAKTQTVTAQPGRVPSQPAAVAPAPGAVPGGFSPNQPSLEPDVPQVFLPVTLNAGQAAVQLGQDQSQVPDVIATQLVYQPALLGGATVRFLDRKRQINEQLEKVLVVPVRDDLSGVTWEEAEALPIALKDLSRRPRQFNDEQGPYFGPVPEAANNARKLNTIGRDLADWLYYNVRLPITVHAGLDVLRLPGESERTFKTRLRQTARERRDEEVDALRKKYATQIDRLEAKLRKYERSLATDEDELKARQQEELVNVGETVLGMFMGRRRTRAISTIATKRRLSRRAKSDIREAQEEIADLELEIEELETELEEGAQEITRQWSDQLDELTTEELHPRRTDIDVRMTALAWLPAWLISYGPTDRPQTASIAAYPQPQE